MQLKVFRRNLIGPKRLYLLVSIGIGIYCLHDMLTNFKYVIIIWCDFSVPNVSYALCDAGLRYRGLKQLLQHSFLDPFGIQNVRMSPYFKA